MPGMHSELVLGNVDWVLLAVLLVSVLIGAWRGLVYEVLSVGAWITAFVIAQWLAADVGGRLPLGNASHEARFLAGLALVFVATLVACMLLITLLKRFVSVVGLRPIDRALGALFGLARGVLLLMVVVLAASRTPLHRQPDWEASAGVKALGNLVKTVVPMLPPEVIRYLPE